jgi:hypothetical protein
LLGVAEPKEAGLSIQLNAFADVFKVHSHGTKDLEG